MNKIKNIALFFNTFRGIHVFEKIKSNYKIKIFLSTKYLDKKVENYLKRKKVPFTKISNLKNKILEKNLKQIDLGISCGFSLIFDEKILKKIKYGIINCHAGKVPEYRGGSPLNWQLINNEKKFGISVLKIKKGIDNGEIIEQKKFPIKKNYNIDTLHKIANLNFPKMIKKSLKKIESGKKFIKQNEKKAKLWPQRSWVDSLFNPVKKTNFQIIKIIYACRKPYEAFFLKNKILYKIYSAELNAIKLKPGQLKNANKKILLGCLKGSIAIKKYKKIYL